MKAFQNGNRGYHCEECGCDYDETAYTSQEVYYFDEPISCDCCNNYAMSSGNREMAWWCEDGCFHHDDGDAPDIHNFWECGACGSTYLEKEVAADCCQ